MRVTFINQFYKPDITRRRICVVVAEHPRGDGR